MPNEVRRTEEPDSRATKMAAMATHIIENHPYFRDGDRVLMMVTGGDGKSGIVASGYFDDSRQESESVAMMIEDLLEHLMAIGKAHGISMGILPVTRGQG